MLLATLAVSSVGLAAQTSQPRTMDVHAQSDQTTTTTVSVGHGAWTVKVPSDEPLVAWVAETIVNPSGQFAKTYVMVQTSEGQWVKLTPCDDIAITCEPALMRVDNVVQGKQFYLEGS